MKKSILVLLLSLFVIACGDNKKVEKVEKEEKVEIAPTLVSITYINSTDQPITVVATWGKNVANDTTVVAPNGGKAVISSNCSANGRVLPTECSEFHSQLLPPKTLEQPNPATGNFWLSYQLEPGGTVKCIRDGLWYSNEDNEGAAPMDNYIWSEYTNWKYELVWSGDSYFQEGKTITNTVEIKTVECKSVADPNSPSKFSCN